MVTISEKPLTDALKEEIFAGFKRHAVEKTGHNDIGETYAFVAEEEDLLLGAVVVELFWGALHIKYAYVHESARGKGLGRELMLCALAFGKSKNCPFAFVETMSFQALDFYQKLGFTLDFTRSGHSHGTSAHYLSKRLG